MDIMKLVIVLLAFIWLVSCTTYNSPAIGGYQLKLKAELVKADEVSESTHEEIDDSKKEKKDE